MHVRWIFTHPDDGKITLEAYIPENTPMTQTHYQLGAGRKKSSKKKTTAKKKTTSKKKTTGKKVRKIHKGPRGGKYYISKGRKVYI